MIVKALIFIVGVAVGFIAGMKMLLYYFKREAPKKYTELITKVKK